MDFPFEKNGTLGFYDTSEEQALITSVPVGQFLRRPDKRKPEEETERNKRQRQHAAGNEGSENSGHQTKFVAARDAQIQNLKEAESIGRRRKLVLPGAQVGEAELEDIVKIGQARPCCWWKQGKWDAAWRLRRPGNCKDDRYTTDRPST